jgi:hypothetical protein
MFWIMKKQENLLQNVYRLAPGPISVSTRDARIKMAQEHTGNRELLCQSIVIYIQFLV